MKLYYHPASPYARKVLIAASLLGIELETRFVDVLAGEGQKPEFLRLNPNGKVPTLEDGDFVLWESNAILQYLAGKKPDTPLFPADARTRADIVRWQFWESSCWAPACGTYVFEHVIKRVLGQGGADPDEIRKAEGKFHRYAGILDGHLSGRSWLVGDAMTLADLSIAPVLMYANLAEFPLDAYSHILRWFGQIEILPAWLETAPRAG
jgi:glutathione S-transferase